MAAPATQPSKQERSLATRGRLIESAREIFARDGFERARLQDIAASAGKTRGAFYAHFRDKEDVFFAIFEQDLERDQVQFQGYFHATGKIAGPEAMARYLLHVATDKRRIMLNLEFKMYALRQPRQQRRLAALHRALCMQSAESIPQSLLPELRRRRSAMRKQTAQITALVEGLGLNRLFDPGGLDDATVHKQLRAGLHHILAGRMGGSAGGTWRPAKRVRRRLSATTSPLHR